MYLSNLVFLVIMAVMVVLYFSYSSLIQTLSQDQHVQIKQGSIVRQMAMQLQAYLGGMTSYEDARQIVTQSAGKLSREKNKKTLRNLEGQLERHHEMTLKQNQIEQEMDQLTASSMSKSDGFIKEVAQKLADENQRSQVSKLERLVIIGANVNTSSNYQVRVLFQKLKQDDKAKEAMLGYVKKLIENTKKDIKSLRGTPFEQMPLDADKANHKIQELTLGFAQLSAQKRELGQEMLGQIKTMLKRVDSEVISGTSAFSGQLMSYFQVVLAIIFLCCLVGMGISVFLAFSISRRLGTIILGLGSASKEVASTSDQISRSSQTLAEGSSEQASSLEETSSSLEEMASMTRQNAENAQQADSLMEKASHVVRKVDSHMLEMAQAMDEINNSSEETGKIIKTIDEISFQTNLLALNAAVEAARAGEHGAGFAVVAEEVRSLALRAAEAARSTSELIENTRTAVKQGAELTQATKEAFAQNVEIAGKVGELVGEISAASSEQSQGIDQINQAASAMEQVTQQVAANAEESSAAAAQLHGQASSLDQLVGQLSLLFVKGSGEELTKPGTRQKAGSSQKLLGVGAGSL
jgi:methyl-accepting chemotaxis protein